MKINQHLPKNLLSTKTIVIVDPGNAGKNWKKISEEAHAQLKRSGIDAVGYFLSPNLFSGMKMQKEAAEFFKNRGIVNLIFITAHTSSAEVWLTAFNSQWDFVSMDQEAWYSKDSTVSKALLPLYQRSALELERKNMLILDAPEFYEEFPFNINEVNKSYPPDLKSFKTGIVILPNQPLSQDMSEQDLSVISGYERDVAFKNRRMNEIMTGNYPFKYDTVNFNTSNEDIRNKLGMRYLIHYVHCSNSNARLILDFETKSDVSEYASSGFLSGKPITRNIPANRSIYKFYIIHLATGILYSGSVWDADTAQEDALLNFINNMKRDFKINP